MQIIPAIDLKDNKCVRLSKGKDNTSVVYNEDPEKQAIYFEQISCKKLHLVDLYAAFGRSNVNFETIKNIRKSISIPIQLGGGVRNLELAKKYFEVGINNLIIGSMSVERPNEVIILSNQYAGKVYVSLDILEDNIKSLQLAVRETQDAAIKLFSGKNYIKWGENTYYAYINGSFIKGYYYYKNL